VSFWHPKEIHEHVQEQVTCTFSRAEKQQCRNTVITRVMESDDVAAYTIGKLIKFTTTLL
jgi:hypothetical protein